jgi:hypothetical protein
LRGPCKATSEHPCGAEMLSMCLTYKGKEAGMVKDSEAAQAPHRPLAELGAARGRCEGPAC